MQYKNPIIRGYNPDPSACRVGNDYYLVTSTFEFYPGVPIYHSTDLANWELISYCLTDDVQLPLDGIRSSKGIFAPTLRYNDGRFYMTTTNVTGGGNFYVYTDDIYGKWSKPIWVDQDGIDPTIFFDDDGSTYYVSTGQDENGKHAIFLSRIDITNGKFIVEPKVITYGSGGTFSEAPHIYYKDGYYYLMLAEGGTEYGHMIVMLRSRDIFGPYDSYENNPICSHRDNSTVPIKCVGHGDLFQDAQDNWWLTCLGVRPLEGVMLHNLGRETFLAPVDWSGDWPLVGNDGTIDIIMDGPTLDTNISKRDYRFDDDFTGDEYNLNWNWVRNPNTTSYKQKNNVLTLTADGNMLSADTTSPVFMGIRQKEFEMEFIVDVCINNDTYGGITAYYNDSYHYDIILHRDDEGNKASIRKKIHDIDAIVSEFTLPKGDNFELKIVSGHKYYEFYYRAKDEIEFTGIGQGMTVGLTTESTHSMSFTGTYLGLFCESGSIEFGSVVCSTL